MRSIREIIIIYDEECPLCSDFVSMIQLKQKFESVLLVNARDKNDPHIKNASELNYDFNKGMLVVIDNEYFYGSEAVWILSILTTPNGILDRVYKIIFRSKAIAFILYPFMRFVRRVVLIFNGTGKI